MAEYNILSTFKSFQCWFYYPVTWWMGAIKKNVDFCGCFIKMGTLSLLGLTLMLPNYYVGSKEHKLGTKNRTPCALQLEQIKGLIICVDSTTFIKQGQNLPRIVSSKGDTPALLQQDDFLTSSEEETVTRTLPFHIPFLLVTPFSFWVPKFTLR